MFKRVLTGLGRSALPVVAAFGLIASAQAADGVKIGSFLAVTGGASFLGDPEKKTLEMYVEEINKNGGVLGKPVELIIYDSGTQPKDAVTFVKRLIEQDKVDVIVGGTTTGETMAVIRKWRMRGFRSFPSRAPGSSSIRSRNGCSKRPTPTDWRWRRSFST
jgi:branched-chain amino acid transport system substrate-binding protein